MSELEWGLRQRFAVREEVFEEGDMRLRMLMPLKAEDLIDEEAFEHDERLPYWAELWPSAKALTRWLLGSVEEMQQSSGRMIELGCGIGLPTLALRSRGVDVLASDHNVDALQFVQANAIRNAVRSMQSSLLDWRDTSALGRAFELAIAADVLYERRNAETLADALPNMLGDNGRLILADPGRRHLETFCELVADRGWQQRELARISEPQALSTGTVMSSIRIVEFRRRD